jgi:hypothetical protein
MRVPKERDWAVRVAVDASRIRALRLQGVSWAQIGEALGVGEGTVRRSVHASAKNPPETAPIKL